MLIRRGDWAVYGGTISCIAMQTKAVPVSAFIAARRTDTAAATSGANVVAARASAIEMAIVAGRPSASYRKSPSGKRRIAAVTAQMIEPMVRSAATTAESITLRAKAI